MWHRRLDELLKDEIEDVLTHVPEAAGLRDLAREPLARSKRGLAVNASKDQPWPLLPLIMCEAICERYEQALPLAASLQLLVAAGDVFDDVEDADSAESLADRYGPAVATNIASLLLILAERTIVRLKERGVQNNVIISSIDIINSYYVTACAGQHLDLRLSVDTPVSEEDYLRVMSMKSASQIECACHLGALLATDNQKLIHTLARLGHNMGMAAQIANDVRGVIDGRDTRNKRMTLPTIYALSQADDSDRSGLESALGSQTGSIPDVVKIRELLFQIGAIHYATVKMELYKQQALANLSDAAAAGVHVERLKQFLA